ncbi:MAG TPA: 16S rRNA (cytosine(1402)-N(4))-methyltransferase RsmH [Candidatus Sulfotelmatobacter sp.]|nr:16S rRNA (cytosine(1402)-N(4))-methyltransferase RsmH [Candidatus Sulfotelmatobacter sp.]
MGEGSTDTPQGVGRGGGEAIHVPVLLQEAIDFLNLRRGGTYIDATVGLGGHSYEIAKRLGAPGHLIGVDKDPHALEVARGRLVVGPRSSVVGEGKMGRPTVDQQRPVEDWPTITLLNRSFADLANDPRPATIDGLLADLGVSSLQLADATRGFSFQAEGPLDMRMDPQSERTAEQVVNHLDERELADVIYEFGEERRSRRIARAIVRSRPIRTTAQLAEIVSAAARPMNSEERRIHPATRTFQALRIFVNRELDDLKALLEAAPRILKPGGRIVVISFHSLEDRIVKDAFREGEKKYRYYRVLTKKPVTASDEESDRNPRARSAKLRAAERV